MIEVTILILNFKLGVVSSHIYLLSSSTLLSSNFYFLYPCQVELTVCFSNVQYFSFFLFVHMVYKYILSLELFFPSKKFLKLGE